MNGERKPRVLVVDNNEELVDDLCTILEDEGYEAVPAHSGKVAEQEALRGFDIALVDLRLPDAAGTSLAERLKAHAPDGEVVLLTGFATLETAIAAVRAGAFAYLVKPCAPPDLLLTVEQALRQVKLHGEKRELARRAQVAEKLAAVGTLTAGLSHEIRNPLNAASLQLTVLERRLRRLPGELQPRLLEPLSLVRDEIQRLEHLLEDFLRFARPRELTIQPLAAGALVEKVVRLLQGDAERRGIQFSHHIEPQLPRIDGDEERLHQVLMNLALNALEATPARGKVSISVSLRGDRVRINVDDSGPGIPTDLRDRIFEPFFTTKPAGSGLGLPIVHAIISQHGGDVRIEKSPLGGTRMQVELVRARA